MLALPVLFARPLQNHSRKVFRDPLQTTEVVLLRKLIPHRGDFFFEIEQPRYKMRASQWSARVTIAFDVRRGSRRGATQWQTCQTLPALAIPISPTRNRRVAARTPNKERSRGINLRGRKTLPRAIPMILRGLGRAISRVMNRQARAVNRDNLAAIVKRCVLDRQLLEGVF